MATDTGSSDRTETDPRPQFGFALGGWAVALLVLVPAAAVLESPLGIALGFLAAPVVGMAAQRLAT